LWTEENPHINISAVLANFGQITKQELKARAYGIPTNLAGRVYPMFSPDIHVVKWGDVPKTMMSIYTILDPHDRKPFALQFWAVHPTGTSFCVDEYPEKKFDEILMDDKTYDDYADFILAKENKLCKIFKQPCVSGRFIDPNFGNKTIKLAIRSGSGSATTTPQMELRKRKLFFKDAYDSLTDGHLSVREALSFSEKNNQIIKQPKIFFVDYCINSIEHMQNYSFKTQETRDGDVKDNAGLTEKWKDFCDLTRYFVMANCTFKNHRKEQEEKTAEENLAKGKKVY
jgi:hypothetical protein